MSFGLPPSPMSSIYLQSLGALSITESYWEKSSDDSNKLKLTLPDKKPKVHAPSPPNILRSYIRNIIKPFFMPIAPSKPIYVCKECKKYKFVTYNI